MYRSSNSSITNFNFVAFSLSSKLKKNFEFRLKVITDESLKLNYKELNRHFLDPKIKDSKPSTSKNKNVAQWLE